ncbi:MAG: hypothetical protein ACYC6G_19215 [Desulfobaccales bacterium]
MSIDWSVVATIAAPIVALLVGAFVERTFENRSRVISYFGHVSGIRFTREGQPFHINTHSVVIRNAGRKTATNVRLGHATLPDFQVYPDIEYEVRDLPGGQKEILFPRLIPKKQITLTYLYIPPFTAAQINTYLESDEGAAKVIPVLLTAQLPNWLKAILWILLGYGIIAAIYTCYMIIKRFI